MDVANIVTTLMGTVGTLGGVALGAWLTNRSQRRLLLEDRAERSMTERRHLYGEFLSTTRAWRAVSQSADARVIPGSAISRRPHADGGAMAERSLALRSEIALVAHSVEASREAARLVKALGRLAEARSSYAAGSIPQDIVQPCRDRELFFILAARRELGTPRTADDLLAYDDDETLASTDATSS